MMVLEWDILECHVKHIYNNFYLFGLLDSNCQCIRYSWMKISLYVSVSATQKFDKRIDIILVVLC